MSTNSKPPVDWKVTPGLIEALEIAFAMDFPDTLHEYTDRSIARQIGRNEVISHMKGLINREPEVKNIISLDTDEILEIPLTKTHVPPTKNRKAKGNRRSDCKGAGAGPRRPGPPGNSGGS